LSSSISEESDRVDNATMKHASDKNEFEDEYYTNTEDDIPPVKLCSFQKKQRESSSSRLSDSEDNIPLKTLLMAGLTFLIVISSIVRT
jgi:hypothetical protein